MFAKRRQHALIKRIEQAIAGMRRGYVRWDEQTGGVIPSLTYHVLRKGLMVYVYYNSPSESSNGVVTVECRDEQVLYELRQLTLSRALSQPYGETNLMWSEVEGPKTGMYRFTIHKTNG